MTPSPRSRNRSSVLFVMGLLLAGGTASALDSSWRLGLGRPAATIDLVQTTTVAVQASSALTDADRAAAAVAWRYFQNNTDATTGFVGAVDGFASTTLWDQGSYVLAIVAARRLGVISDTDFDDRAARLIASLSKLPLFDGRLPNKAYDTRSLAMTDYENNPQPHGIGWSAIDLGRFLLALQVLQRDSPAHAKQLQLALSRWDICAITSAGELWGAERAGRDITFHQEGRIGYEQYAARAAALWGCDSFFAATAQRVVAWASVSGVDIPADLRDQASFGAIAPTVSEPYLAMGLELGYNRESEILAARIYAANEARFRLEGIPTAATEDHLDRAPYFAYASVYDNGTPWAVTDKEGNSFPELRTISLKAAFAWDVLYATPYTSQLRTLLADLADPAKGWSAGKYERGLEPNATFSLNTNAFVLEAMHYKAFGPLLRSF